MEKSNLKTKNITHLWFDLGYTLVYLNREQVFKQIINNYNLYPTDKEIAKAFHLADKIFMRKYPGMLGKEPVNYLPWYLGIVTYKLGASINLLNLFEEYDAARREGKIKWYSFPEVNETLSLLSKYYYLGLISNWDTSARQVLEQNSLSHYFDTIVISSEVGIEKPNSEIFELALKRSNVKPESSIYIGDNYYDDGVGSKKVGLDFILINRFGDLGVEELEEVTKVNSVNQIPEKLGFNFSDIKEANF